MSDQERTYVTMAGKSIGKCAAGHWLPLSGNCDLCGAGPDDKCRFRPFYGAECRDWPNCSGGCGLGCTKEIESSPAR